MKTLPVCCAGTVEKDKTKKGRISANERQGDDKDYLFIAAKNIAIKIFEEGRTRNNALELVSKTFLLANDVIRYVALEEPISEPPACRAGCHYCCFYQVVLTPPEALLIGSYVEKAYTERDKKGLMNRIDKILELTDGKTIEERVKVWHDTPCIFLANGKCSVYHVRPFICAAWHSLDGHQCKEAFESYNPWTEIDCDAYRYHVFQTVKEGLQEACSEAGCQTGMLTIARAMNQYLHHKNPIEAWVRGDKVFIF